MQLKRLNAQGLEVFSEYLDGLKIDSTYPYPQQLLIDSLASEPVTPAVEVEHRTFGNRFEAAKYLDECLSGAGIANLVRDAGIWAWLALYYFDQLCPVGKNGERRPGELARWIPEVSNFRRYYRHLLAGPYRIYVAHRDSPQRALALLCGPLHKPGDVVEQFAARPELVTNKGVVELVTKLYYDVTGGHLRRGSSGKGNGSPRRLADVCNQFDVAWDLYSMTCPELSQMLPEEFKQFMS